MKWDTSNGWDILINVTLQELRHIGNSLEPNGVHITSYSTCITFGVNDWAALV